MDKKNVVLQGKRLDQVKSSEKFYAISVLGAFLTIVYLLLIKFL